MRRLQSIQYVLISSIMISLFVTSCNPLPSIAELPTATSVPTVTPSPTATPTPTPTPFVSAETEKWFVTILRVKRGEQLEWNSRPLIATGQRIVIYGHVQNLTTEEIVL